MEIPITIHPLLATDQEFLWEALYEALWDPPLSPRRPRSVLEHRRIQIYAEDWCCLKDDLGFVAVSDQQEQVGAVWSRLLVPPEEGGAFFGPRTPQLGIAVFPAYQGRCVGSRLMQHYLSAARNSYPSVSLGVHPENQRAIRLYKRFGFTQFAEGSGGYLNMVLLF